MNIYPSTCVISTDYDYSLKTFNVINIVSEHHPRFTIEDKNTTFINPLLHSHNTVDAIVVVTSVLGEA